MRSDDLVLGIDAGGSKTVAWLARRDEADAPPVGRGTSGPANPVALGIPAALQNLQAAVDKAFADAGIRRASVAAACLAIAGSDRPEVREPLLAWAQQRQLAANIQLVHDAEPVLADGTPEGCGIALLAGTGSFAFGRNEHGQTARAGGWGYLFGDEGSGYAIALAGLRAAAQAADGRARPTALLDAFLERFGLSHPGQLVNAIYSAAAERAAIASLAEIVFVAADGGDATALAIREQAAQDLSAAVSAVARRIGFDHRPFAIALSGSVIVNVKSLRDRTLDLLQQCGHELTSVAVVREPVSGAVTLARRSAPTDR